MKTQKILNLSSDTDNESSKFARRKWYVSNDQNNGEYGEGSENDSSIKFETKVIKSSLCDYLDPYILVTGDIKVADVGANTNVALKTCAPFTRCVTHINDENIDTAENLDIMMLIHNLIEYSDNYSDTSGSLYQFEIDEFPMNGARSRINVALDNSSSFKYKSGILGKANAANGDDRSLKNVKLVVPFKCLIF